MRHLPILALVVAAACHATARVADEYPIDEYPIIAELRNAAARAPLVVGHRGDSHEFPENTMPAFRAALDRGSDVVELDVFETKDGVLVCFHDKTLDRTTDAEEVFGQKELRIADKTYAELQELDAGKWKAERFAGTRIPKLADALDLIQPRAVTLVEHKHGRAEAYVELLRRRGLVDKVVLQSFDWDWLAKVHALEPRLALGAIGAGWFTEEDHREIAETGAVLVHWRLRNLRLEDVPRLRRKGYLLAGWTPNGDSEWIGSAIVGVDMLTTDLPGRLRGLIDRGIVRRR